MYTLKFLVETFSRHAIEAEKGKKKFIKEFKENYPDEPLPEHVKDDFNLPEALACICMEIMRIDES